MMNDEISISSKVCKEIETRTQKQDDFDIELDANIDADFKLVTFASYINTFIHCTKYIIHQHMTIENGIFNCHVLSDSLLLRLCFLAKEYLLKTV